MRSFFTLIELIVVIAVLGILAAIIIPNISSFQEEANESAILSNVRNLQTSVDMYGLDNYSSVPTQNIPLEDVPQPIDFNKIYPDYTRDLPETEGVKYWVDFQGKVWASTIDSPSDVAYIPGELKWTGVENAAYYNVFKLVDNNSSSSIKNKKTIFIKKLEDSSLNVKDTTLPNLQAGEQYLVSAIDDNGFESPPVGTNYNGYVEVPFIGSGESNPTENVVAESFSYTGSYQEFIVPETGLYKLEVWGAEGGAGYGYWAENPEAIGGKGGYAYGEKQLNKDDKIYIYIGGKGSRENLSDNGGWNGGGSTPYMNNNTAAGGGGATDIRTVSGLWNNSTSLNSRIIVAGGGGGGGNGSNLRIGGHAGGLISEGGLSHNGVISQKATQSSGYSLGGGQDATAYCGGGGGGYYGGYVQSSNNHGGGSGGSSYIGGLSNSGTNTGINTGHGKATITYIGN